MFLFIQRIRRKFFFTFSLFIFLNESLFCADWVLAAKKFAFTDDRSETVAEDNFISLMPQLVLERLAEGLSRNTSEQEMLDRSLNTLLVERQSLFLQLSKEVKVRDGIVLTTANLKKMNKKIAEQEKVIEKIEIQIDENLEKTRSLYDEFEKRNSDSEEKVETDFSPLPFNPFKKLFVKKKDPLLPETRNESVVFYKNDVYALFEPSADALNSGIESRRFESEVINAKINALIDGKITVHGSYFSITCTMYNFPGRKILGSITEVGSFRDYISVAENIAAYFVPVIANSFPVEIYFDITPDEVKNDCTVAVDGNVYEKIPEKVVVVPGIHSVKIECDGYISRSITYEFEGSQRFLVKGNMEPELDKTSTLVLKNPYSGTLYAGIDKISEIGAGTPGGMIHFDGTPVIGQFKSSEDDDKMFFYYIQEELQKNQSDLIIKGKPLNHSEHIDRRRIMAYRAYTALVLSVPFTIYTVGKYNSMVNAYNIGSLDDRDEVYRWRRYGIVSTGITFVCLGFFGFELVRYFIAANSVLPSEAREARPLEVEKSMEESYALSSSEEAAGSQ